MTDAQDTIELPVFGLTLKRSAVHGANWYELGDMETRITVDTNGSGYKFVGVYVLRGDVGLSYGTAAIGIDTACERLLAQMTPDDVAAIRALGER